MKFAQQLTAQLTPEWRKQYIQYDVLKDTLYTIQRSTPPGADEDDDLRKRYLIQKDEKFFNLCFMELQKINLFFHQKLAEAQMRSRDLMIESEQWEKQTSPSSEPNALDAASLNSSIYETSTPNVDSLHQTLLARSTDVKNLSQLKFAFSEFYLSLILLQNFQQLNSTGFQKILKKHDKVLQLESGHEWLVEHLQKSDFYTNKEIDAMIEQTENLVTVHLEHGDRQAAMKRLRVPPLSEKQNSWTTFRFGLFLGSFIVLCFLIILTLLIQSRPNEPAWVAVRLFRGFILLFANVFLMGFNMYGWQKSGVNHVLIFEIDPRNHLKYQSLMEVACFFAVIWALCVLGYLFGESVVYLPSTSFPLILATVCLAWLLNPLPVLMRSSRMWFLKHCFFCFTAPFHYVAFPDFWLGDQMNSLATCFTDFEYFACFYAVEVDYAANMTMYIAREVDMTVFNSTLNETLTYRSTIPGINPITGSDTCSSNVYLIRPFFSIVPALVRFLQCLRRYRDTRLMFPHLVNAGKYSMTFFVTIFSTLNTYYKHNGVAHWNSPFYYLWVLSYVANFCYTFGWDIKMDWGLLDKAAKKNVGLRDELVYGRKWCYYAAVVEDFVLRATWLLNVSLADRGLVPSDLLTCITAPLEVFRRFLWNYFRLENEHVNNCGQFRAVRDISIKPLKKNDFSELERFMNEKDGVSHRGEQYQQLLAKILSKVGKGGLSAVRRPLKMGRILAKQLSLANIVSSSKRPSLANALSQSKRSSVATVGSATKMGSVASFAIPSARKRSMPPNIISSGKLTGQAAYLYRIPTSASIAEEDKNVL